MSSQDPKNANKSVYSANSLTGPSWQVYGDNGRHMGNVQLLPQEGGTHKWVAQATNASDQAAVINQHIRTNAPLMAKEKFAAEKARNDSLAKQPPTGAPFQRPTVAPPPMPSQGAPFRPAHSALNSRQNWFGAVKSKLGAKRPR